MNKERSIAVRAVRRCDGPAIEALFGPKGAVGGCWCMYWRREKGGKSWDAVKGEPNRVAFMSALCNGDVTGVLAMSEGKPVGWCSIGPKTAFPRFARSRVLYRQTPSGAWSLNCFFILPSWRRKGVTAALIDGAIELARNGGASEIEAYPSKAQKPGSLAPAFAWTGVEPMFAKAGFKPCPENPRVWVRHIRRRQTSS
jgi:GNAT superfamily N-acetyltransferase